MCRLSGREIGTFPLQIIEALPPRYSTPNCRALRRSLGGCFAGCLHDVQPAKVSLTCWPLPRAVPPTQGRFYFCGVSRKLFQLGLSWKRNQLATNEGGACTRQLAGRAHVEKTLKGQGWEAGRQPSLCPGVA